MSSLKCCYRIGFYVGLLFFCIASFAKKTVFESSSNSMDFQRSSVNIKNARSFKVAQNSSSPSHSSFERAPARSKKKKVRRFDIKKSRTVVPKARKTIKRIERQMIKVAKPPAKFRQYFDEGTDEAELEQVINEEIKQLFTLLKSSKRRDLRLRLGSLYIEKVRLIEYRLYEKYDREMLLYEKKKRKTKPKLRLAPVNVYINKAVKLFETYRRQFPRDKNMDQVLFFLGVSYFKRGWYEKGRKRYEELIRKYPRSEYINNVNFELGEYYFNKSNWVKATFYYRKLVKNKRLKLYSFSLYKLAWCYLKQNKFKTAMIYIEKVIAEGRRGSNREGMTGSLHFASQALRDLPLFYNYSGKKPSLALSYFQQKSGSKRRAVKMLKELAYIYLDTGNLRGVRGAFKQLIRVDPASASAYDYQYQIVRAYSYAGSRKIFLDQLKQWLVNYGPGSAWVREHEDNSELVKKVIHSMELTVRNYALRMHQSYRKTKGAVVRAQALYSYDLYNRHFPKSKQSDQMRFFYAELLFDLRKYSLAAKQYLYVIENFPKSKYYETASLNSVLTVEKTLPSSAHIRKKIVGSSVKFVPFTRPVNTFQKVAYNYINRFPNKPNVPIILYKLASLHYEFNHHKEALSRFWHLIEKYPKSRYTEYSANLILDIYNLNKDFKGLRQAARRLLKNQIIAKSASAKEIRKILSQLSLNQAEELAKNKQYLKSAQMYKIFADAHPKSPLRGTAYYNSAVNFKKSGDTLSALKIYQMILKRSVPIGKNIKSIILKEIPSQYQKTGQYRRAAGAFINYAKTFPRDKTAPDFWFNAALIYDGFNSYKQAEQAYLEYFKRSKKKEKTQALYLLAELKNRRGHITKAMSYYSQFLNRGSSDKKALTESAYKIAEIKKAKKDIKGSRKWYRRTLNLYNTNKAGVFYAAQSQFNLVYDTYLQFIKIRIPANPKKQQQVVKQKLNLFNKLKEELKQVIRFDSGDQVVASLVLIGLASQSMGDSIYNSPLPKGLNAKEISQYKEGLKKTALPFQKEAKTNYHLAIKKSRNIGTYNAKWLIKAKENLRVLGKGESTISPRSDLRKELLPVMLYDWSSL